MKITWRKGMFLGIQVGAVFLLVGSLAYAARDNADSSGGASIAAPAMFAKAGLTAEETSRGSTTAPPAKVLGMSPFAGLNFGILGGNTELKSGIAGGGELGLMGDYFLTSIQVEHYSKEDIGVVLRKGNVSLTPVMFNFYGRIPLVKEGDAEKVTFRSGGGFDYIFVSHDLDTPQVGATTITEDIDSGVGFHVGGGFDYWVSKEISLSQDFTYLFFQPDVTVTKTSPAGVTQTQGTVQLDTIMLLFKVAYHF